MQKKAYACVCTHEWIVHLETGSVNHGYVMFSRFIHVNPFFVCVADSVSFLSFFSLHLSIFGFWAILFVCSEYERFPASKIDEKNSVYSFCSIFYVLIQFPFFLCLTRDYSSLLPLKSTIIFHDFHLIDFEVLHATRCHIWHTSKMSHE